MAGGGQLRDAEDPARRVVRLVRPGVTYIDGGELKGGGRSSGREPLRANPLLGED